MQRDWQIAGWSVTPKSITRKGESTRNNNEKRSIEKAFSVSFDRLSLDTTLASLRTCDITERAEYLYTRAFVWWLKVIPRVACLMMLAHPVSPDTEIPETSSPQSPCRCHHSCVMWWGGEMAHRYQLSGLPDHEQSPSNLSELCHQAHNPFWYFQCLPLTWDFQQTHS